MVATFQTCIGYVWFEYTSGYRPGWVFVVFLSASDGVVLWSKEGRYPARSFFLINFHGPISFSVYMTSAVEAGSSSGVRINKSNIIHIPCSRHINFYFDWLRNNSIIFLLFCGLTAPTGPGPLRYQGFTITLRHTTFGRTALDEWSARRRDVYLTTHNTHTRQSSMLPAGFEPAVPANERPKTHALYRVVTGIGNNSLIQFYCSTVYYPICFGKLSPSSGRCQREGIPILMQGHIVVVCALNYNIK